MDLKKLEEKIYSEDFAPLLRFLTKEEWEKLTCKQKMSFLAELQVFINSIDASFPKGVYRGDFKKIGIENQFVYCGSDGILVDNSLVVKSKMSSYTLLMIYLYEIMLSYHAKKAINNVIEDEKDQEMFINTRASYFGEWSNFYGRKSENFGYQPLTYYTSRQVEDFMWNLVAYMNKNYGMDKYLGKCAYDLMDMGISDSKVKEKCDENYQKMKKVYYDNIDKENAIIKNYDVFIKNDLTNLKEFNDDDFYSLFSKHFIDICNDQTRFCLYKEFISRVLNDYDKVDELVNGFGLGESEKYGHGMVFNKQFFKCREEKEFDVLIDRIIDFKLSNGLLKEIEDEKYREEVIETFNYLNLVAESKEKISSCISTGYAAIEAVHFYYDYYYNLVKNAIEINGKFKGSVPANTKGFFSKKETYLRFVYDRSYERIKEIQFKELKEVANKIGGRR